MPDFTVESCRSCDAPIIWAVTASTLKPMPVDAAVVAKGGNVALEYRSDDMQPLARVLPVAKQFGRTNLRQSHFVTCPHAGQWRRRRS
jgi:uncharacterized protein GlcG (DUF336 family)